MKKIHCSGQRTKTDSNVFDIADSRYELCSSWAQWPSHLEGCTVFNSCYDPKDDLLYVVTGKENFPVVVFDSKGQYLRSLCEGKIKKSHNIFVSDSGTLWVADSHKNAHVILEFEKNGMLIRELGKKGIGSDSGYTFDISEDALHDGRHITVTKWNRNLLSNARLDSIVRRGEPFNRPCSIVQHKNGDYYAADGYGNCAVHHFDKNCVLIHSWGKPGSGDGEFRIVHDICIDKYDRIWVADRENARVHGFSLTGEAIAMIEGELSRIGGICCDEEKLYIGELDGGLTVIDLQNLCQSAQIGAMDGRFKIHGISCDTHGNLYLSTNKANSNNLILLKKM